MKKTIVFFCFKCITKNCNIDDLNSAANNMNLVYIHLDLLFSRNILRSKQRCLSEEWFDGLCDETKKVLKEYHNNLISSVEYSFAL